ncbi:MAG: pyrroline-5-carboxylate reductase, partial [Arenicella sp.]|nr:pyrroline-5-carboxylate reductase [Arenicella sp.]
PNTPALVSAGATGLYANEAVTEQHKRLAELLFDAVGITCWVPREEDIDSVTALSGSGPAYFMLFIKSLIDAATAAGLDPHTAKTLAFQTAKGSVQLIDDSGQPLQTLIDGVTSPKGTTESALKVFQAAGLSHIVSDAFEAARLRAQQLAKDLDPDN